MIANLRLQNFRSYTDDTFEFSPAVNIIVGPNASGKTNLLESVLVIARGSSYRAKDIEMIGFEKPWGRIDAVVDNDTRVVKLMNEPLPSKSYELSNKPYKRLTLAHSLPIVLFEPNNLQLLHGSPDGRRNYLDELLEQQVANYGAARRNYRRILAQRNALLKRAKKPTNEELFPWNLRLSEFGAYIARQRRILAESFNERLADKYREIATRETSTEILYDTQFPVETYETHMLQKLESNLAVDAFRGFTTTGPHREDFRVLFDGREAAETASRGETRTLVLSLKVIELELLEKVRGTQPILLLDDVFSELDGARRHALTDHLANYQTFITTTDADIVSKHFTDKSNIIPLSH